MTDKNAPTNSIAPNKSTDKPKEKKKEAPPSPPKKKSIKMPPLFWDETQKYLSEIEKKVGGPVISFYTAQSMVGDDVKYFYAHLKEIGFREKLFLILLSHGGDGKSSFRIASLLRNYCNELIIIIPEVAASAATILSLSGDRIIMTPLSYLTAVDTSLRHPLNPKDSSKRSVSVELEEVKRAVEALMEHAKSDAEKLDVYKSIFEYIHPVSFGAMQRTSNLSEMLCRDIMSLRNDPMEEEKANDLIDKLNREYPAHGYPITRDRAKALGLPVEDSDDELNNWLWRLQNTNRVLTKRVRTDINESFFHSEQFMNSIESVGQRVTCRKSYERRLDPIIKGWTTLREEYDWEVLRKVEKDGKNILRISTLDI